MSNSEKPKSSKALAVLGIGLVVLIAVAAVFAATREPTQFAPDSPEGVVQGYLVAVLDGQGEDAHSHLSPDLQSRCHVRDIEDGAYRGEGNRITLVESRISGDHASVKVEFSATSADSPFDVYEYSYKERFDLDRIAGEWRISEPPWPLYWCSEVNS